MCAYMLCSMQLTKMPHPPLKGEVATFMNWEEDFGSDHLGTLEENTDCLTEYEGVGEFFPAKLVL